MNTPDFHEEHAELCAALKRVAAHVPQPDFDPALHASTMRRLEALTDTSPTRASFRWPALAAAVVGLLVLSLVKLAWTEKRPIALQRAMVESALGSSSTAPIGLPPSIMVYERAAAQGDEQFVALLDHAASQPSFISLSASSPPSLLQR